MPPVDAPRVANPAPRASTPVANLKTANNPRGVAITPAKPARVPKVLTTSANPRGTAIIQPSIGLTPGDVAAYHPAKLPPKPVTHLGSTIGGASAAQEAAVQEAAILHGRSLASMLKVPAGILGHLGDQVIHLPESTLVGAEQLGVPAVKGLSDLLVSGNVSGAAHEGSKLLSGVKTAVKSDPVYQATVGGKGLKALAQNPLGTILDATALYGLAGKAAGAGVRAAGAGGDLARAPRLAAPGVEGSAIARGYSPNLFTQAVQKAIERIGPRGPRAALALRANHELRLQNAAAHTAERGQYGAEVGHYLKTLKSVKPPGKEEAAVAPIVAMTGQNRLGLERLYNEIQRGPVPVDPETVASRQRLLGDLEAMMRKDNAGKFDWAATNRAASAYHSMAQLQEAQKAALGMRDITEMNRRLDNARALLEPNVHYLDKPVSDPRLFSVVKDAAAKDKEARAQLNLAQRQRAAYIGAPDTRGAYRAAQSALGQMERAIPTHPATDTLMNTVLGLRRTIENAHPNLKAFHDANVESAQEAAATTAKALKDARKAFRTKKLVGTVIEDHTVPPLRVKPLKGLSVRPLEASDVAALRHGDPAIQSYVSARNPERAAPQPVSLALGRRAGDRIIPMSERGQAPYTGEAITHGDLRTGWSALPNTLLKNASAISEERETQAFLHRFELKHRDETGVHRGFATPADAKVAARDYEHDTGIKMSVLADRAGGLHVVPSSAVKELNAQRALDTRGNTFLAKVNRAFRKTVLPYSPKLPVMHTVENASRVAALEKGNVLRAVPDYFRGRAILGAASPTNGERLASLVTPGSLTRSGSAGEAEDVGRLVTEPRPLPVNAVHHAIGAMSGLSNQIIRGQRWLEHGSQTVALGAHGRQLLQEMGHSWTDANTAVNSYADKLAQHLATPADAERAAQYMHNAMGKYNAFTATTRAALRVMPFGSWYLNAARLVFVTLPREHPLFDALLQDTYQANKQQWEAQHQGLPADMQTSLPVGDNAYLDIGKLTPIGLPNQAPETTLSQLVLPQFGGAAAALMGKDPFYGDLKGPDTAFGQSASPAGIQSKTGAERGQAALSAIDSIIGSVAGPTSDIARILYGHGGTLYNTSTPSVHLLTGGLVGHVNVKPGTPAYKRGILNLPAAIDKVLDPFHPTTFHVTGGTADLSGTLGHAPAAEGHLQNVPIGRAPAVEGR